jgi:Holliday junction resolvase RusA-like endonuclease
MLINLEIPGNPKALKRHRHTNKDGVHRNYDPSSDDKRTFLDLAFEHKPDKPIDEPISVGLHFYFERPKSHYGTGKNKDILKPNAPKWHTSAPDIDNLQKFCFDSFNGVFWKDDSIICQIVAQKIYSDNPRTEIIIHTIENEK